MIKTGLETGPEIGLEELTWSLETGLETGLEGLSRSLETGRCRAVRSLVHHGCQSRLKPP